MLGSFVHSGFLASSHAQIVAGIVFFAILTGAYTIYGGLRSAAWTDFMQIIILGAGGVLVPILGLLALRKTGGVLPGGHQVSHKIHGFLPLPPQEIPLTAV